MNDYNRSLEFSGLKKIYYFLKYTTRKTNIYQKKIGKSVPKEQAYESIKTEKKTS